jgi:hypothetical protein
VSVEVPKNTASAGGFSFGLPAEVVGDKAVTVNSAGGAPLPKWLKFDPSSNSFIATKVPDGGLPLTVEVNVAGAKTSIVISNAAEEP